MTHPGGRIALLNDSAFGVHPPASTPAEVAGARPPGTETFALDKTGYHGARTSESHSVICDAGPLGTDYQPGHGHADLFSFDLSLRGSRVVVDRGVFTCEAGPMRDYCRSTGSSASSRSAVVSDDRNIVCIMTVRQRRLVR